MPDVYVIYISEKDLLKTGESVSWVKKTLRKDRKAYDDGSIGLMAQMAVWAGNLQHNFEKCAIIWHGTLTKEACFGIL